ncbi:MAG: GAF domain-containing sensor histidine kinase [Gomphosphaeria aponina SAG 52.96 = DSM 107014]|uniref:histidine kinase n=1 Tax=Gomphosphaeria aponina SAG 52.96 = DSM 107014 TaxID=1521640 RepID=A0A941GRD9_9CHRO|nr:GAF domain-containing sensor histidine kinase [Gomphosphaeria aponina SAG 52.96 = DSM 107014]
MTKTLMVKEYAKSMEHNLNEQIRAEIIQIIQENPERNSMLSQLNQKLESYLGADTCLIVAGVTVADTTQTWCVGKEELVTAKMLEELYSMNLSAIESMPISEAEKKSNILRLTTQFQGQVNGMIVVREGKLEQKQLLLNVSNYVAIAIALVQLQQQVEGVTSYQGLLQDITRKIRQSSDMDSILNLTLVETGKALKVDRGLIVMLKYKDPLFKSRLGEDIPESNGEVVCNWPEHDLKIPSYALSESSLCQQAWKKAPQPLALSNQAQLLAIKKDADVTSIFPSSLNALLIVPLIGSYSGETEPPVVLGFLILQQFQPRIWETSEIDLAKWVAIQASTSILHNQALHQVQSLVKRRTEQLEWSLQVQAKLSEKMRQHIEELERLNQVKDEFISTLSDELKHPLAKIKMGIEMLKIAPNAKQRQRYLGILESECAREIELVNDLLTLQKLESEQFNIQPQKLDLIYIITELSQSFEKEWADKGLKLTIKYHNLAGESTKLPLIIYTDAESINRIFKELLKNAGKFSDENTTIFLEVTPQANEAMVISLTNTGRKISPEEQAYIFEPFRRGQDANNGSNQGTGLGLALVKSLVEHINGTIDVSSEAKDSSANAITCFTLTLPQLQNVILP